MSLPTDGSGGINMMNAAFDPDFADPNEWARMYRAIGFQVVPAMTPRENRQQWKRPALPKWRELEHERVPDFTFERWYGENGEHARRNNMGVIAGACSDGLMVIDLDFQKDPRAQAWWMDMLDRQQRAGELETIEQVTGGGGAQLFFRVSAGFTPPTCKTSIGVDIRGQGGFAMLPPSMHESGTPYRWKPGCEPWDVEIADAPQWLCDAVVQLAMEHGGASGVNPVTGERELTSTPAHAIDSFGNIVDGREDYMTRLVWAAVVNARRDAPIPMTSAENAETMMAAFANYERHVKSRILEPGTPNAVLLEREGRGLSMFQHKWANAMAQWDGKVAVAAKVEKPSRPFEIEAPKEIQGYDFNPETGELTPKAVEAPEGSFEVLDVKGIKSLPNPNYLIDKLMIETALGFVFGAPGCGKSFITIGMALSIAAKQAQWFGRDIKKTGPVVYISSEGVGDMKYRIAAWERETGINADDVPFYLIRQTINFMLPTDVDRLIKTVAHVAQLTGQTPVAIFVDTVSRVLPGADENLQKDMTLFISACDALRTTFDATVVGVHHTSRAGNLRGSTVFDGAGDFLLGIEREEGETVGYLNAKKIKSAQDGWTQPFELKSVVVNDITGEGSLYACPCDEVKRDANAWPAKDVCRKILQAISKAWHDGKPWSSYPQTRKQGRYAAAIISKQFDVVEKVAENMIDTWLNNEVLSYEMVDKNTKMQGLRVVGGID
jgi:hypothetical protein